MKYRILSICLILLIVLLCGCECKHEWKSADCTNPQICSKCGVSGEAALGHSWASATCIVPETCSRCTQTQGTALGHDYLPATCTEPETCTRCAGTSGEALGHSFGEWQFPDEGMVHTCQVCNFEETLEFDMGIYLETLMLGHWDLSGAMQDEVYTLAWEMEHPTANIVFTPGKTYTLTTPSGDVYQGTWEFIENKVDEENGSVICTCWLFCKESNVFFAMEYLMQVGQEDSIAVSTQNMLEILEEMAENDQMDVSNYAHGETLVMTKNQAAVSRIVGNWGISLGSWQRRRGNCANWFSFREDRTVTGYMNGPIEGTWHLVPIVTAPVRIGYTIVEYKYDVVIKYEVDGKPAYLKGSLYKEYGKDMQFVFQNNYFAQVSEIELAVIKRASGEFLGSWKHPDVLNPETGKKAYFLTFHADGTFTASLGEERTGTWYLEDYYDTSKRYSESVWDDEDKTVYYEYMLSFDDQEKEIRIVVFDWRADGDLYFQSDFHGALDEIRTFYLDQGPEELPIWETDPLGRYFFGTWVSDYIIVWKANGGDGVSDLCDCFLAFNEDGTFYASMGEIIQGTWKRSASKNPLYYFDLEYDGGTCEIRGIKGITDDQSLIDMTWKTNDPNAEYYYSAHFTHRMNPPIWETDPLGQNLFGEWVSEGIEGWNAEKWESSYQRGSFYLSLNEDGTFYASMGETIQGTWKRNTSNPLCLCVLEYEGGTFEIRGMRDTTDDDSILYVTWKTNDPDDADYIYNIQFKRKGT